MFTNNSTNTDFINFIAPFSKSCNECNSGIIKGGNRLLIVFITFERLVVDVENDGRKSIKRSLNEHDRDKLKDIYIVD